MYSRHVIKNKMRKADFFFFYYFDILDSESFEINQLLAALQGLWSSRWYSFKIMMSFAVRQDSSEETIIIWKTTFWI